MRPARGCVSVFHPQAAGLKCLDAFSTLCPCIKRFVIVADVNGMAGHVIAFFCRIFHAPVDRRRTPARRDAPLRRAWVRGIEHRHEPVDLWHERRCSRADFRCEFFRIQRVSSHPVINNAKCHLGRHLHLVILGQPGRGDGAIRQRFAWQIETGVIIAQHGDVLRGAWLEAMHHYGCLLAGLRFV